MEEQQLASPVSRPPYYHYVPYLRSRPYHFHFSPWQPDPYLLLPNYNSYSSPYNYYYSYSYYPPYRPVFPTAINATQA
jgi:hypothetical protein